MWANWAITRIQPKARVAFPRLRRVSADDNEEVRGHGSGRTETGRAFVSHFQLRSSLLRHLRPSRAMNSPAETAAPVTEVVGVRGGCSDGSNAEDKEEEADSDFNDDSGRP